MEQFRKISLIFLLIKFTHETGEIAEGGCKSLWDNTCLQDKDCCSNYCFRESHWAQGVCKTNEPTVSPSRGEPPSIFTAPIRPTTKPTISTGSTCSDNSCRAHSDCCSQYCRKNFSIRQQRLRGQCLQQSATTVTVARTTPSAFECGQVNITIYKSEIQSSHIESILGGADARFGTHPWQVLLLRKTRAIWNPICGGALINNKWILTAGHCVHNYPPTDYMARLGEWDTSATNERLSHEDFRIEYIKVHPKFKNRNPNRNDIALMKLRDTVEFKSHIIPICLPGSSGSLDGRKTMVTGWGVTENGLRSEILKEVEVDIIPKNLCREWYKGKSTIGEEFFCAGYEEGKKDSCQGDSGGPLSIAINSTRILVGIVSFGYGCGQEKFPGVYTNVSYFSEWIEDEIDKGDGFTID